LSFRVWTTVGAAVGVAAGALVGVAAAAAVGVAADPAGADVGVGGAWVGVGVAPPPQAASKPPTATPAALAATDRNPRRVRVSSYDSLLTSFHEPNRRSRIGHPSSLRD